MHEVFPDAPIYTSAYLSDHTFSEFQSAAILTLPGSWLVNSERRLKALFPLWVFGFARLNLRTFDVVLSSTTWGAKFVSHAPSVRHVSYCYAPTRLLWSPEAYNGMRAPIGPLTRLVELVRPRLQALDVRVMQRIARVATSCQNMATAIADQYGISARIIHPPIRMSDYSVGLDRGDFYLTVSRLIAHKRVDLAIEACRRLGRKLVVVGDGPDAARLRSIADGTVKFAGRVGDEALRQLYRTCRALIFPSKEDFGLAPLEAQASGSPVVAYGVGGVRETMIEGRTGVFFGSQDSEAIVEAILRLEHAEFDAGAIRESVRRFDVEYFKQELRDFVLG